jgi:hypothetical protein
MPFDTTSPANEITPQSTVLLEKLTSHQLVKKFSAFRGTPKVHYRIHKRQKPVPFLSHSQDKTPQT